MAIHELHKSQRTVLSDVLRNSKQEVLCTHILSSQANWRHVDNNLMVISELLGQLTFYVAP